MTGRKPKPGLWCSSASSREVEETERRGARLVEHPRELFGLFDS